MKKIKNFFTKNIKIFLAFVLGILVSFGVVYAATVIGAGEVSYTNNSQTSVQSALDDLYTLSNTWINPSYIDFTTLATNTNKTILASKNGICIKRNNKVSCFKVNNWSVEKDHIKQVFSGVSCNVSSSSVDCDASDFYCLVYSNGNVICLDYSDRSLCNVISGGSVNCDQARPNIYESRVYLCESKDASSHIWRRTMPNEETSVGITPCEFNLCKLAW